MTAGKITVSDRNALAFYLANGQKCQFVNNRGRVEGVFQNTPAFERVQADYVLNAPVKVQSFIAASRMVSEMILRNRMEASK
ncbi:hypothetical protein JWJ90_10780 [Desulfobulbus rhabdoformis]|uniref:hypothetical protein n=1 Tax=Desulfobulbus rhabdoformis TaxID=34032 RepID=UPI001962CD43|nr:hypothetical protein [Desulfobulbus rhabdoformis]MBM9614768.1 hypothetical protein [Desulfobulbus rhabdoformis]